MSMFKILTLNNIATQGLERLPRERYEIASEMPHPDAVIVRSADMHQMELPAGLLAVGRAGAGVNNIPVAKFSEQGTVVFNAPGANANAVKELVLAGMLVAARNLMPAWQAAQKLDGDDKALHEQTEAMKKRFAGFELPGRTLGVVGLGAIGVLVANAARALGMRVVGYDPGLTVQRALSLSSDVQFVRSVDELLVQADFVTFHVPLNDHTRNLLNAERLTFMKDRVVILNFAREGVIDEVAVCAALDSGKLHAYVSDFPSQALKNHPRVVALPHLGASTAEAETNCAIMVADQIREYLEHGNIKNSVNLPDVSVDRRGNGQRLTVINRNVPNMVGQISHLLGEHGVNIVHMVNDSKGNIAYTLVDVEGDVPMAAAEAIRGIDGVLRLRVI